LVKPTVRIYSSGSYGDLFCICDIYSIFYELLKCNEFLEKNLKKDFENKKTEEQSWPDFGPRPRGWGLAQPGVLAHGAQATAQGGARMPGVLMAQSLVAAGAPCGLNVERHSDTGDPPGKEKRARAHPRCSAVASAVAAVAAPLVVGVG
jgi:hypothetical protein